jgi:hypothetical protein
MKKTERAPAQSGVISFDLANGVSVTVAGLDHVLAQAAATSTDAPSLEGVGPDAVLPEAGVDADQEASTGPVETILTTGPIPITKPCLVHSDRNNTTAADIQPENNREGAGDTDEATAESSAERAPTAQHTVANGEQARPGSTAADETTIGSQTSASKDVSGRMSTAIVPLDVNSDEAASGNPTAIQHVLDRLGLKRHKAKYILALSTLALATALFAGYSGSAEQDSPPDDYPDALMALLDDTEAPAADEQAGEMVDSDSSQEEQVTSDQPDAPEEAGEQQEEASQDVERFPGVELITDTQAYRFMPHISAAIKVYNEINGHQETRPRDVAIRNALLSQSIYAGSYIGRGSMHSDTKEQPSDNLYLGAFATPVADVPGLLERIGLAGNKTFDDLGEIHPDVLATVQALVAIEALNGENDELERRAFEALQRTAAERLGLEGDEALQFELTAKHTSGDDPVVTQADATAALTAGVGKRIEDMYVRTATTDAQPSDLVAGNFVSQMFEELGRETLDDLDQGGILFILGRPATEARNAAQAGMLGFNERTDDPSELAEQVLGRIKQ